MYCTHAAVAVSQSASVLDATLLGHHQNTVLHPCESYSWKNLIALGKGGLPSHEYRYTDRWPHIFAVNVR